jgi:hypothetical protein
MLSMMFCQTTKLIVNCQISSSNFLPIKEGICHIFIHHGFQIKNMLLLLLFLYFYNVQVLFYVIFSLISCLCLLFHLLYLIDLHHYYILMLFIYVFLLIMLSFFFQGEKVTLMI